MEETYKSGLDPFLSIPRAFAILFVGQVVDVLGTMKKIQYFLYTGKYLSNPVPNKDL
jgi:hypothetical protein